MSEDNNNIHLTDELIASMNKLSEELSSILATTKEKSNTSSTLVGDPSMLEEKDNIINKLTNDNASLNEKVHSLERELNIYTTNDVTKLIKAYELFLSFKSRTRDNLKNVFETETFLGFVSKAMQWNSIAAIWEQAKRKFVNTDDEDTKELRELFLILFNIYNSGYQNPPYELIIPSVGTKYDMDTMIIMNDKSRGNVQSVLLEGYISKDSG